MIIEMIPMVMGREGGGGGTSVGQASVYIYHDSYLPHNVHTLSCYVVLHHQQRNDMDGDVGGGC